MNNLFLSASDTPLGDAAIYAVVGFVIVTVVLAALVGIFSLTGYLFSKTALGNEKLFSNKRNEPVVVDSKTDDISSDEDVVAAVTAAITVMLEEETGDKPEFVIRRIVRKK